MRMVGKFTPGHGKQIKSSKYKYSFLMIYQNMIICIIKLYQQMVRNNLHQSDLHQSSVAQHLQHLLRQKKFASYVIKPSLKELQSYGVEAKKVCIICNQAKSKGDIELWRICEINRAATFLAAFQFNQDDVYTWCIFHRNVGDIFAAEILYHNNCMANYVLKFKRDMAMLYVTNRMRNQMGYTLSLNA